MPKADSPILLMSQISMGNGRLKLRKRRSIKVVFVKYYNLDSRYNDSYIIFASSRFNILKNTNVEELLYCSVIVLNSKIPVFTSFILFAHHPDIGTSPIVYTKWRIGDLFGASERNLTSLRFDLSVK